MRTLTGRAITTAAAAAIALTTMSFQPAAAATRRGDDAAAAFLFAGFLGTIAAIVASQHYDDHPYYAYGPVRGPVHGGPAPGHHGWQPYHHR
jgi:hypothetical protein